jgi:hypothetical protein
MDNKELYHEDSMGEMLQRFPEMSKKEITAQAQENAKQMLDAGEVNEFDSLAAAERLKHYSDTFCKELRKSIDTLPEKTYNRSGVEFTISNTGDRKDYMQDELYAQLSEKVKQRKELLDLAYKSDEPIYDSEGVEVPKVGIKTHGGEVLKLKF